MFIDISLLPPKNPNQGRDRMYGSWIYNYLCNQCLKSLKVVSSNIVHGEVYLIQHYVKSLSVTCDRSEVFSWYSNKTDWHDIT